MFTFGVEAVPDLDADGSWREFLTEGGWLEEQEDQTYATVEAAKEAAEDAIAEMECWVTGGDDTYVGRLIRQWNVLIWDDVATTPVEEYRVRSSLPPIQKGRLTRL